jgi:hypothetical protein
MTVAPDCASYALHHAGEVGIDDALLVMESKEEILIMNNGA